MNQSKKNLFNKKDLVSYFFVAGTGAFIQLLSGALLKDWFGMKYQNTLIPAYIIAFIVGFILTKLFAFDARNTKKTKREIIKFSFVSICSGLITYYISIFTYQILNSFFLEDYLLKIPNSIKEINFSQLSSTTTGMGFSFVFNYIMHKSFTFKESGFYDKLKNLLEID